MRKLNAPATSHLPQFTGGPSAPKVELEPKPKDKPSPKQVKPTSKRKAYKRNPITRRKKRS